MAPTLPDDPRSIVTPDAFQVAPELLGLPLAAPWRRLVALLVDLLLIAILSRLGGTVLALSALLFFVMLARREKAGRTSARRRVMVGCLVVLITMVTVPAVVGIVAVIRNQGTVREVVREVAGLVELERLRTAESREVALEAATAAAGGMRRLGVPTDELERTLRSEVPDSAWAEEVVAAVMAAADPPGTGEGPVGPDPSPEFGIAGVAAGEAGTQEVLIPQEVVDSLTGLQARLGRLEDEAASLRRLSGRQASELDELRARGGDGFLVRAFRNIFEDLGLAFGFGTIYLTVFTAWWKGRTPGKRLLGVRVVQLDGRPLTWWASFERAGGYAAGLATGLLGFAQIFWDPNRQAIHDRISSTVVVLDGKPPVPGRWRSAVDVDPGRGVRYDFEGKGGSA